MKLFAFYPIALFRYGTSLKWLLVTEIETKIDSLDKIDNRRKDTANYYCARGS